MSKATFRNDSGSTVYLEEYGHQQILNTEIVTISDDNQSTKFADSTQLISLINAGDIVYIDDLSVDRTAADAIQILEAIRDIVVAGGVDGDVLCTDSSGDLVWGTVAAGTSKPTGLTDFHEVWKFYEQGATGDIYLQRADGLLSRQFPGSIALADGQVVHVTSTREKSPTKYCDIVVRKQTPSASAWNSGTWTDVGAGLTMNNTVNSDTFTNLTGYTFSAGDAISVYLDKSTPSGGSSCEDPFVAVYVKYD